MHAIEQQLQMGWGLNGEGMSTSLELNRLLAIFY